MKALIIVLLLIAAGLWAFEMSTAPIETPDAAPPCSEDPACIAQTADAPIRCHAAVTAEAAKRGHYEWLHSVNEQTFTSFLLGTSDVVILRGNTLRLRTEDGYWRRVEYSCRFNHAANTVDGKILD
jgi:hypothetical protein